MSARIHESNLSFTTIQVSWGLFQNSFFSHLQGEGIFEGKPEFALFGHRALDLKHDFAVFFFPNENRWVDSHINAPVRIVEVMWVGLGAGSPGLVDGTL